jgi:hypothetical protein
VASVGPSVKRFDPRQRGVQQYGPKAQSNHRPSPLSSGAASEALGELYSSSETSKTNFAPLPYSVCRPPQSFRGNQSKSIMSPLYHITVLFTSPKFLSHHTAVLQAFFLLLPFALFSLPLVRTCFTLFQVLLRF